MQHKFTQTAALLLAFVFLFPDLLASARAATLIEESFNNLHTPYSGAVLLPALEAEPAPSDEIIPDTRPEKENRTRTAPASLAGIVFHATEEVGYMGDHPSDPMNLAANDVFRISIDGLPQQNPQVYAYLTYRIYGLEDGLSLPKSINGAPAFVSAHPEKKEGWQKVSQAIPLSLLKEGVNEVRFNAPNNLKASVEVRDVEIRLSTEIIQSPALSQVVRPVALPEDFSAMVKETQALEAFVVKDVDMPAIPRNIINVTRNGWGYLVEDAARDTVNITIGVNPAKLMTGNALSEVQLFYFDRQSQSWKASHTALVDIAEGEVGATAPGGTNYFAGLIKTPEMPEASAFMPTAISDIKAANPAAEMSIMQPPSISQTGEASISYPLAIPAGRQGMTPSLNLNYSSDASTGWLGVGWNINVPSVSIDTRWGAPVFDPDAESEVYVLNGQSLTMEGGVKANRYPGNRISALNGIHFFTKTMASYKEVIRHGDGTDNYCWEEITADGTHFFYGTEDGNTLSADAIITDENNDIVTWNLKRVEDKWGNYITYNYTHLNNTTQGDIKSGGKAVLLNNIRYTGDASGEGKYKVEFVTSGNRIDATVSLKSGRKEVDGRRLETIKILYYNTATTTQEIRRFEFQYTEGDFFKTLLSSVEEWRSGKKFYEHNFEYYSEDLTYSSGQTIEVQHFADGILDGIDNGLTAKVLEKLVEVTPGVNQAILPSPISTTLSFGYSVGGSAGLGLAPGLAPNPTKSFTFSGHDRARKTFDYGKTELNDINGDGLPDLIYNKPGVGNIYYPLKLGENGEVYFQGSRKIYHDHNFFSSRSSSRSYGWDFALSPIFSYGQNWNETYSKTTSYTADYNADGILDAVLTSGDQSHVYFGKVGEYGKIFFSSSSELTPNPVKKGVSVTIPEDEEELKDMEVIRIWEAPFEGTIDIDGQAEVIATSDDDVKVGIQLNSSFLTSPNMVSINGTSTTVSASTEVRKGDKILFRCNSKENGYGDLLEWNPSISYTTLTNYSGTTRIDPNGLDYANTNYEDAFLLSAPEGVNFFGDQAIKVTWSPGFNVGSITDSVTLQIVLFKQDTVTGDTATNHYSYVIKPNGATSISPSQFKEFGQTSAPAFLNAINLVPNSSANDLCVITFKAVSTSNIDWKEINWRPEVRLGPVCGVNYENIYPAVHYQTYNRLILMDSPAIAASGAASDDLRTWPEISLSSYADAFTSDELASSNTIEIQGFFVTKTINKLLSKVLVKLDNNGNLSLYEVPGPLQSSLNSVNKGQSAGINSFKRSDLSNAKVFAGFYCSNKRFADFLKDNTTVDIYNLNSSTSVPETADIGFDVFCRIFNELQDYNLHWGQCGWSEASIVAIDTSELHLNRYPSDELDFSDGSTPELADFTSLEEEQLNPKDQKFFTLNALRGENTRGLTYYPHITDTYTSFQELDRWAALSTHIASYGSGAGVAPGKLNETPQIDEPEIVVIPDNYSAFATPLKSKSFTKSESFGASFFMHSETIQRNQYLKEKVSSFIDLNGDRYPDVNNMNNGIQSNLTDPFGGHKNTSEFGSGINALGQSKTIEATNLIAGQYINDDLRFIGIKEKNNTLEIGEAFNEYDWVDINGDGLIDRIDAESNSLWVELNSGKGLLAGYNVSNLRTTSTKNYTYPLANLISSYVGAFDIVDNSFAAGVNITATGNKAQVTYLDFNGDGLNDMLKYNGSSVSLQLNTGTSFQAYGNMDLSEIDDVNFSRQLGISVKGAGGYSFPLFTLLFVHFKGNLKGDGNLNLAANKLESVMRDMNGDGLLDYVKAEDNGDLTVHYCELKKSNLLKKVINPLGGSFTLDYERVGNKYGDYPVAIKIHTTKPKDRMVWDMPQSKWILAYLKVNDGLDIVNSSNDIDGVDSLETWFNYDGGIYSRREREFLGFTRVESRERANRQIAIEDHPKVFLTHVTDYDRPIKNDFNYRKRFEYTRGIPYEEYILRHKETYEEGEFGFEFKYYIDPIEETHYNFEYRLVSQDVESEYFNQVDQVDEDFTVVDLENDELPISEVQTVFPALTDFEIFTFPQLENNQKDKYFAKKFNIKYDGYTNVTEYKSEGSEVPGTPEDRIVDMFISTRYEDTTFSVYYSELLEGESPFDGDSYNENGNRCYLVSVGSFRLDTLCFPASLFEPVVNPCGPEPEPIGSEETFEVVLRKRVVDTTFITERVYPTTYLARITAQMDYFAPVNAAGQTNFLSEHRIYLGTINPSGLKRKSVVEARTSGSQADLAPAQIAQYLADGTTKSIADIVYDNNGNVIQLTGPPNHTNQRFSTYFTYDTEVKQFVKRVANSYGEEICNSYNYKTGKLLRTVDINGNATGYSYDDYERLVGVFAPYAFSSTSYAPTIAFVYHPEGLNPSSSDYRDRVPYALTYHNVNPRDPVNSQDPCWSGTGGTASAACDVECDFSSPNRPAILNPLTTVTFMDGLQRVVQVKKDVSKKNGSANDRYREVSGISTLDYLGRETSVSLSVSEDITTNTLESLNSDRDATLIMKERSYDYASRPISEKTVTEGGGYVTSGYSYLWDQSDKFYLQTNFVSQTKTYLNGWGQTTKVIEDVGGINATTLYSFDALNQILSTQDPLNEITSYTYDNMGRLTEEDHPDRGVTSYTYDKASNLVELQSDEMGSGHILMQYNYGRISKKIYPQSGHLNNLFYTYGSRNDGVNGAGRVVKLVQGTDYKLEQYAYDELGHRTWEKKSFKIPQAGTRNFETSFNYDAWGRIQYMIYPDGEQVDYTYNSIGDLESIVGSTSGSIIDNILYDGFGNIKDIDYGNQTSTSFTYDAESRLLTEVGVWASGANGNTTSQITDKTIGYDSFGRVSSIADIAGAFTVNGVAMGGTYNHSYTYDDMSRLTHSTTTTNMSHYIKTDLSYNTAGGITGKTQQHLTTSGGSVVNPALNYDLSYDYAVSTTGTPHQVYEVSSPGDPTYRYNYNQEGSVLDVQVPASGGNPAYYTEQFRWDNNQQLSAVNNVNGIHHYTYDQNGERVLKATIRGVGISQQGQSGSTFAVLDPYTVYNNAYFVATHYEETVDASKHYYMGSTRVASALIMYPFAQQTPGDEWPEPIEGPGGFPEWGVKDDLLKTMQYFNIDTEEYDIEEMTNIPSYEEYTTFDYVLWSEGCEEDPQCLCELGIYWAGEFYEVNCAEQRVMYWYHPDYLGNTEWVTDQAGLPHQYYMYTSYGENAIVQNSHTWHYSTPYRFNAQEYDGETGNYYYGARYYNPRLSNWLSVDPMSAARSWLTPYNFVQNNPINLVDPTGMLDGDPPKGGKPDSGPTIPPFDFESRTPSEPVVTTPKQPKFDPADFPDLPTKLPPQETMRAWEPTWVDNWSESTNFFASAGYDIVNSFWVTLQALNPFDNRTTTMTGESLNGRDNSEYGVTVAMTLMPMGLEGKGAGAAAEATFGAMAKTTGRGLWKLTEEGASMMKYHSKFGKLYKSASDNLWWAVDRAGHGGSKFKVFKETKKGLKWYRDADEFGDFILTKHKGSEGKFIPWGQLKTIK